MGVTELTTGTMSPHIAALRTQVMERKGSFIRGDNPYIRDVALLRAVAGRLAGESATE